MNKIMLLGRISKDVFIAENDKYAIITIAIPKDYDKTQTDFIPVLVSGQQISILKEKLYKGDKIFIQGHVTTFTKDGKLVIGLNADAIDFISPGKIHRSLDIKKEGEV